MLNYLLSKRRIRRWIAFLAVKYMEHLNFYKPATLAAPKLKEWLKGLNEVQSEQLRRLILVVLRDTYIEAGYYDIRFTTMPNKELYSRYSRGKLLTKRLLFAVYNTLSLRPIESHVDYEEQVGGFPPPTIDVVNHLSNFVKGNQQYKVILETEQICYKKGESVNVSLTIQNLTDGVLILHHKNQETGRFVLKSSQEIVLEKDFNLVDDVDNSEKGLLLKPYEKKTIKWFPDITSEGYYWVSAEFYAPYYEEVVDLTVEFWYEVQPENVVFSTRDFFTL